MSWALPLACCLQLWPALSSRHRSFAFHSLPEFKDITSVDGDELRSEFEGFGSLCGFFCFPHRWHGAVG